MDSEDNIENKDSPQESADTKTQAEVEAAGEAISEMGDELPADELSNSTEDSVNEMFSDAREIADRLEVLMPAVLDSAEATNNTAEVTVKATAALETAAQGFKKPVADLVTASERSSQISGRVIFGSVAALLVALSLFTFMSFQLSDRVSKVDAMIVAVSKRVVDMNSSLSTFEEIKATINNLAFQQEKFASNQMELAKVIDDTQRITKELRDQVPKATAKTVGEKTDGVVTKLADLEKSLQSQSRESAKVTGSVANLSKRLQTLESKLKNVDKLNADVAALIKLERDNYLEVLRRKVDLEEARQNNEEPDTVNADPTIVVYPAYN
jgi:methyl-accepting chemotaxis protein